MPPYLSIECEWLDQPLASDPLERRTWARLHIAAAGRAVTRLWDHASEAERTSIFVPAYPVARWLLENWWALLHEPSPTEAVSSAVSLLRTQGGWVRRHCLRSAESGILLPRAFLYADGRGTTVEWTADEPGAYPHMPGYFVGADRVHMPVAETQRTILDFAENVARRLDGLSDPRAAAFKEYLGAISRADEDERAFCRAAGRLGLDPYSLSEWDESVLSLIEHGLGEDPDRPLAVDFLEASDPTTAARIWTWVADTERTYDLRGSPRGPREDVSTEGHPAHAGYRLAEQVRQGLGLRSDSPLDDVSQASEGLSIEPLQFVEQNHLTGFEVRAAVGWRGGREPVIVGPRPRREEGLRFLQARALYHAAFAAANGARLITTAHTWDQQASRAFAAELLAPQEALVSRFGTPRDRDELQTTIDGLAAAYRVDPRLIEHQLANAGVPLGDDETAP